MNQDTCPDALGEAEAAFPNEVERLMGNATEFASNSLAIVARLLAVVDGDPIHRRRRRRLLEEPDDFSAWITAADRRLLLDVAAVSNKVNVVVAKDGSGHVKTINGAMAMAEKKSKKRFVIQVKADVYEENLMLNKSFWNVMIIGEGKTKTIITGSKNFVDGTLTFATATFAVSGKGFIARDLTIRNTARRWPFGRTRINQFSTDAHSTDFRTLSTLTSTVSSTETAT